MADTPGWVSNADLAARLSALVDRWNQRENEMIDFISYDGAGDITVHTGDGAAHSLKSFPQLEAEVTAWLDPLAGAVAQAQDINSQTIANANAAASSAQDAADSAASIVGDADAAAASASDAAASASAASASATQASASAADAATSETNAAASATAAASSAGDADTDAIAAALSAQAAADSATQAGQAAAGKLAWFGVWNIAGGTLPPDAAVPGFYLVSGTATIGSEVYADGDMLVWGEESSWHRIDNQQTVASVAGLVGTITVAQLQSALMLGSAAYKNVADFATAAQGTKADAALPASGIDVAAVKSIAISAGYLTTGGTWARFPYINVTGNAEINGNLSAANLSGVNTGDQDLSGYLQASTTGWGGESIRGVVDYNTYTLGSVHGDQGGTNTPLAGTTWFNTITFGANTRRTQFASQAYNGSARCRTFIRNLHDSAWGAWVEVLTTATQPRVFVQSTDPGSAAADGDLWFW